jgi:hypothetical protein
LPAYLPLRRVPSPETAAWPAEAANSARDGDGAAAPPSTPARNQLRSAIAFVAAASAGLAKAQQPVERLSRLRADCAARVRRRDEWRADYEAACVAALIAGEARPVLPPELIELERDIEIEAADDAAAQKAITILELELQSAGDRVRSASRQRDQAVHAAALEICREYVLDRYSPALEAALEIECVLRSVVIALRAKGDAVSGSPDTSALSAASQLEEALAAAKREAGVRLDHAPGRRLLERLMVDPGAELE